MGRNFRSNCNHRSYIRLRWNRSRRCVNCKSIILDFPCIICINTHIWGKGFRVITTCKPFLHDNTVKFNYYKYPVSKRYRIFFRHLLHQQTITRIVARKRLEYIRQIVESFTHFFQYVLLKSQLNNPSIQIRKFSLR